MEIVTQRQHPGKQIRDTAEELPPEAAPLARLDMMVSEDAPCEEEMREVLKEEPGQGGRCWYQAVCHEQERPNLG